MENKQEIISKMNEAFEILNNLSHTIELGDFATDLVNIRWDLLGLARQIKES